MAHCNLKIVNSRCSANKLINHIVRFRYMLLVVFMCLARGGIHLFVAEFPFSCGVVCLSSYLQIPISCPECIILKMNVSYISIWNAKIGSLEIFKWRNWSFILVRFCVNKSIIKINSISIYPPVCHMRYTQKYYHREICRGYVAYETLYLQRKV